jgi:putative membrane protein
VYWWGDMPYGGGGAVLMIASMLLFWGGLITTGILLTRHRGRRAGAWPGTPRRLLDERYARGEIDEEEYRRRREVLDT